MGKKYHSEDPGEFLWLMSLSDLMILLFIFFVTLYSFAYKKLNQSDYNQILEAFGNKNADNPIDKIEANVTRWLEEHELTKEVAVERKAGQIQIQLKDKLMFPSGDYSLLPAGTIVLRGLAVALDKIPAPYKIAIDGHTDNVPMRSATIQNNRELSAKRAIAVFNTLSLSAPTQERVVIGAFGETQPMAPNEDASGDPIPGNQALNRRVTIRIY